MADSAKSGASAPSDSASGDADSRSGFWSAIRGLFEERDEQSLRAQLEEAIDEHVDDRSAERGKPGDDLSPVELQMLRNLLHFSEHDADDVAIPRGEIIAISADASWVDLIALFAEHVH